MKAVWVTDIHVNFLTLNARKGFYETLRDSGANHIFITGDIAEANELEPYLERLRETIYRHQKVYFVVGNHDYYSGSIEYVKKMLEKISHGQLCYLPARGITYLNDDTSLVGVDGWADGRYGNYTTSPVVLNDSRFIEELHKSHNEYPYVHSVKGKAQLLAKMQQLADKDAKLLDGFIGNAIEGESKKIIVLTHIPPFPEASLYEGKIADDDYLPFYTCKATGDVILDYATRFPEIRFLVLCGHSHNKARYEPLHNLTVKTGEAEYYMPKIQEVFEI